MDSLAEIQTKYEEELKDNVVAISSYGYIVEEFQILATV
jgi:hypothetical protein